MCDRVGRRHPGCKRETPATAFERGEACLERRTRGVAGPRVLVALVLPHRLLRERRGLEDGDNDRAGRGFGFLPGMDGERLESGLAGSVLHVACQYAVASEGRPSAGAPRTRAGPPS